MTETHRAYFNRIARDWDHTAPPSNDLDKFLGLFGVKRGDIVLDAGAGTGRLTVLLADRVGIGGRVVAVDFAEAMLEQVKHRCGKSALVACSDMTRLCFKTGIFDKIICFSTFPHFRNRSAVLAEMHRVLRPKGRLLILHTVSSRKLNVFHSSLAGPVAHDRLPLASQAARLLKSADFEVPAAFENDIVYWVEGVKKS